MATVTGAGSKWTNSGTLYVGHSGSGELTIEAGGQVSNTNGYLGSIRFTWPPSPGQARCGLTAALSTSETRAAARSTIEAGGQVSSSDGYLGYNSGSTGAATVTGASSKWTNSSTLYVGNSGSGALTIEAGGQVSNIDGYLGYNSGSTGTATVTGAGSKWTNSGSLDVGDSGSGALDHRGGRAGQQFWRLLSATIPVPQERPPLPGQVRSGTMPPISTLVTMAAAR